MTTTQEEEEEVGTKGFPLEAKVILTGLTKAPEYNGKQGIVKSSLNDGGRQQVLVGKKFLGLKPTNLLYHTRPVDKLSLQELKTILKEKDGSINFSGMDAADLRTQVSELDSTLAFEYLATANARAAVEKAKAADEAKASSRNSSKTLREQADQITNISPDQLRQQARAMRSIPPDQIRRMNPQFRSMTDAEILQAANQMEQMAESPELVRMAADQVKNMTPEQLERTMQNNHATGTGLTPAAVPQPAATATTTPQNLDNVSSDQLKQQAQMMRSMSKDQIRQLNPQLAGLTDAQIDQSIQQMEAMSTNPAMFEMVKNQVKGMTPEQIAMMQQQQQQQQHGSGVPLTSHSNSMMGDGAKMMENMDATQLKQMMKMLKENPDMLKQMLPPGVSDEQFKKTFAMFDGMSDAQMESTLKMIKGVQKVTTPVQQAYSKVNALCGGHLMKIVGLIVMLYIGMFVYLRFFANKDSATTTIDALQSDYPPQIQEVPEDSEF